MFCFVLSLPPVQQQLIKNLMDQAVDLALSRIDYQTKAKDIDPFDPLMESNVTLITVMLNRSDKRKPEIFADLCP